MDVHRAAVLKHAGLARHKTARHIQATARRCGKHPAGALQARAAYAAFVTPQDVCAALAASPARHTL